MGIRAASVGKGDQFAVVPRLGESYHGIAMLPKVLTSNPVESLEDTGEDSRILPEHLQSCPGSDLTKDKAD